jgi:uncharacterized membrane protein YkoI
MLKPTTTAILLCAATVLAAQTPTYNKPQTPAKPTPAKSTMAKTPVKRTTVAPKPKAKIAMATARATALKEVPNGKVKKSKLERENGKLIYSFEIKVPGTTGFEEVNVDAVTGAVVSKEHETPKIEAKENKQKK